MGGRDDLPDVGVRVEPPVERARTYRAERSPNLLRVKCGWGFRDLLLAVPACALAMVITLVLAIGTADLHASAPEAVYLALIFMVATSLVIAYVTAALLLNHTVIVMGARELTCSHGPLPWRSRMTLPTEELRAFEVEKRAAEDRSFVRDSFDVVVRTAQGPMTLLWRLPDLRSAMQATEELNRHLRSCGAMEAETTTVAVPSRAVDVRTSAARRFARIVGKASETDGDEAEAPVDASSR